MKTLEELLRSLDRQGVEEVTLISDNPPYARVGAALEPIDDNPWSTEALLSALVAFGGSRHVEDLAPAAKNWTARVAGLGIVGVAALQRGDEVQARFKLNKRDGRSIATPPPGSSERPAVRQQSRPDIAPGPPPFVTARLPAQRVIVPVTQPPPALASSPAAPRQATPTAQGLAATISLPPPPAVEAHFAAPPAPEEAEIRALLASAREAVASDLHLIAGRPPLYRVAGELLPRGRAIDAGLLERLVMPLVPERLHSVLAENGSCDFALAHAEGRFRVNVSRQLTGLKACLRLISREVPTVEGLRLHVGIAAAAQHHQGLIIFTGPTGHGKTTTLNAVVDRINRTTSHHVITVEDPIEHLHGRHRALMSQREVGTHTKSFASALKASLREDPDVIVVGELRDLETVRMAVAASETGHLVLGTMNTPSAARTIDRLIDLFPPADQPPVRLTLAAGLRLIVSQRLVPGREHERMHAAFELLPGSIQLAALIRENKTFQIPSLQQRGKALGIVRLDDSLAELVAQERVGLEEARTVADAPQELEAAVTAALAAAR